MTTRSIPTPKSCWRRRIRGRFFLLIRGAAFASRLAPTFECRPLWERACSRTGRHWQQTIRISLHEHHRKPQGLPTGTHPGDPFAVRDHRAIQRRHGDC
ncbi:hypothetical protein DMX03_21375 [Pseudomonas koreensis]|nr:hypothetical protein DMX03_21375 [Pseudomonas koreensis]